MVSLPSGWSTWCLFRKVISSPGRSMHCIVLSKTFRNSITKLLKTPRCWVRDSHVLGERSTTARAIQFGCGGRDSPENLLGLSLNVRASSLLQVESTSQESFQPSWWRRTMMQCLQVWMFVKEPTRWLTFVVQGHHCFSEKEFGSWGAPYPCVLKAKDDSCMASLGLRLFRGWMYALASLGLRRFCVAGAPLSLLAEQLLARTLP